ncbi:MAG: hypothetical protein HY868_20780 [Chloroflexi bacterium]|nr:hypothetical protein [Chloroflexota bacterium]
MKRNCNGARALRLFAILSVVTLFALVVVGPVSAQGPTAEKSANRGSPAVDCAIVTKMAGFPSIESSSLIEPKIVLDSEGVVIRESYIKDGKIVIPPSGLYYTKRTSSWRWPLVNYPVMALGKVYYLADVRHFYTVKKDFVIKKGERVPYGLNLSALELSSIGTSWGPGSLNQEATFQVLKPSGNYYGSSWHATSASPFARSSEDALALKPTTDPIVFQTDRLSSVGTGYLVVKSVTEKEVEVAEWVANEINAVDIAEKAVAGVVAEGQTLDLGKFKAKVVSIDTANNSAKLAIVATDAPDKVLAEKTLGPLTDKIVSLFPSNDKELDTLMLKHADVQVALDAYRKPFKDAGKVALVGYVGVTHMDVLGPWKDDPRFIVYFDT